MIEKERATQSLEQLRRQHRSVRIVAPARNKEGLIAAIYLALDAPEYAADNYDALADIVHDLGWLPEGPVRLAWVENPALPAGVQRQVMGILKDAARDTAGSKRPLSVHLVTA
ncbi:MAG: hypothetical protein JWM76_4758 [Pseudonocardiales bacterium]|nr:hypothetical protein [Pseudonocardiales bacterium]